jgi:hypothetical protein
VCWKGEVECITKHWRGSGPHDNQQERKATFDPDRRAIIQAQMLYGGRVRTCVSAPKTNTVLRRVYEVQICDVVHCSSCLLQRGCAGQEKQIDWGSVGGGYLFQLTEGTTGDWTSTHGWYALPTFNINRQVGVFADFANLSANGKMPM